MKSVVFTRAARKALKGLDAAVQVRIADKLNGYAAGGSADVTELVGEPGSRMRVGDFRVVFVETDTEISVLAVGHRRDVYR